MADTFLYSPDKARSFVQVRLHGELFERLESWRRAQPKIPSRAVALRQLVERALTEQPAAR
jgi:hypothetical protein